VPSLARNDERCVHSNGDDESVGTCFSSPRPGRYPASLAPLAPAVVPPLPSSAAAATSAEAKVATSTVAVRGLSLSPMTNSAQISSPLDMLMSSHKYSDELPSALQAPLTKPTKLSSLLPPECSPAASSARQAAAAAPARRDQKKSILGTVRKAENSLEAAKRRACSAFSGDRSPRLIAGGGKEGAGRFLKGYTAKARYVRAFCIGRATASSAADRTRCCITARTVKLRTAQA